MARIEGFGRLHEHRVDIGDVRQLRLVELLNTPAAIWRPRKAPDGTTTSYPVLPARSLASRVSLESEHVIGDGDAARLGEVLVGVLADIVGPVVDIDLAAGGGRRGRGFLGRGRCRGSWPACSWLPVQWRSRWSLQCRRGGLGLGRFLLLFLAAASQQQRRHDRHRANRKCSHDVLQVWVTQTDSGWVARNRAAPGLISHRHLSPAQAKSQPKQAAFAENPADSQCRLTLCVGRCASRGGGSDSVARRCLNRSSSAVESHQGGVQVGPTARVTRWMTLDRLGAFELRGGRTICAPRATATPGSRLYLGISELTQDDGRTCGARAIA